MIWRQFRLLARNRVQAMLDAALFSRAADPIQFAIWVAAFVATLPFLFAAQQTFTYTVLRNAEPAIVERVLFEHRLFFVTYAMLAAAFVTSLTWEALFPNVEDLDIVGTLPVTPATFSAAYLAAALGAGAAFTLATTLPGAFLFSLIAGNHFGLVAAPRAFAGHVAATLLAGVWTMAIGLTLRGACAVLFGARLALRLGSLLQLMTITALGAVLFFLPGLLRTFAPAMLAGHPPAVAAPLLWFAGLFFWIAGTTRTLLAVEAIAGLLNTLLALGVVAAVYVLPAALVRRRAFSARDHQRASGVSSVARVAASAVAPSRPARAVFAFAITSLLRSRRHAVILATHLGLAVACVLITLLATVFRRGVVTGEASAPMLMLPLFALFFVVLGLRAAFAVPTELDANWTFRITALRCADATAAVRAALLALGVLPCVLLGVALFAALAWPADVIARVAALQAATGIALVEAAISSWNRVPFASAHTADPETVRTGWLLGGLAVVGFAWLGALFQLAAAWSTAGTLIYLATAAFAAAAAHVTRRRNDRLATPQFDSDDAALQTLNLS